MKAFVLAEHPTLLCPFAPGARTIADEVVLVAIADLEVSGGCADKIAHIALPEGAVYDDAAETVISVFDAEGCEVVLVEPTRRMKSIAGKARCSCGLLRRHRRRLPTEEGRRACISAASASASRRRSASRSTPSDPMFSPEPRPQAPTRSRRSLGLPRRIPLKLVASKPVEKSGVDLFKAEAVVAAGRGFAEKGDLDLARALCDKIGAGLGCSRPLTEGVDWLPSEVYIGVSGLMLAPKVYVACGISGQMQHMVGCNRATTLFAVNKDKNAPIFKQCDFGLVGDIKEVLRL